MCHGEVLEAVAVVAVVVTHMVSEEEYAVFEDVPTLVFLITLY